MHVCMYVCMYLCMYVSMYVCIYVCICAHGYVSSEPCHAQRHKLRSDAALGPVILQSSELTAVSRVGVRV